MVRDTTDERILTQSKPSRYLIYLVSSNKASSPRTPNWLVRSRLWFRKGRLHAEALWTLNTWKRIGWKKSGCCTIWQRRYGVCFMVPDSALPPGTVQGHWRHT